MIPALAIARGDVVRIFRTTPTAANPGSKVASIDQPALYGVMFVTVMDGFVVGNGYRLLNTIDGGTSCS